MESNISANCTIILSWEPIFWVMLIEKAEISVYLSKISTIVFKISSNIGLRIDSNKQIILWKVVEKVAV